MSKRVWGANEYPLIFHELLKEGGGVLPEDSQRWTYASTRRRWFAFVAAAKKEPKLAPFVEGSHWKLTPRTDGDIIIERVAGPTALAHEVLTLDRFEKGTV